MRLDRLYDLAIGGLTATLPAKVILAHEASMDPRQRSWLSALFLASLYAGAVLIDWPFFVSFEALAFSDKGSFLKLDLLLKQGLFPYRDFEFSYGSGGLVAARIWYALFGHTNTSNTALLLASGLGFVWGVWRILRALEWEPLPSLAMSVSLIPAIRAMSISPVHILEPMFLAHGFAWQLRGRRDWALAMALCAVLIKPSMGFVFGFLLMVYEGSDAWRNRRFSAAHIGRFLLPASAIFLASCLTVSLWLGFRVFLLSLFPFFGVRAYAGSGFGFFSSYGSQFWFPESANWKYYVGSMAGFFLVANALLILLLLRPIYNLIFFRTEAATLGADKRHLQQTGVCAALCHLAFVFFFFGHPYSWIYYFWILTLALVLGFKSRLEAYRFNLSMVLMTLAVCVSLYSFVKLDWITKRKVAQSKGLWAEAAFLDEWHEVKQRCAGRKLGCNLFIGGMEILEPNLLTPGYWMFVPDSASDAMNSEFERIVREADALVIHLTLEGQFFDTALRQKTLIHSQYKLAFAGRKLRLYLKRESQNRLPAPSL